jgi:hypothetical protein
VRATGRRIDVTPPATKSKARLRAHHLNPEGISHTDAVLALREAGYSDDQVAQMIETVGSDPSGSVIWRWRPLDPTDGTTHDAEIE